MKTEKEMQEKIAARLKQYFQSEGISQQQIADTLDTSRQYVNGVLAGRTPIGKPLAYTLAKHYGLRQGWLLSGEEPMLGEDMTAAPDEGIPLIPINAMAGALSGSADAILAYDCERYIVPAFKNADFLIRVQGDSMEPKYFPGDIVACQRVPMDRLWFQWGKTYVLDTIQGALIKRLEPSEQEGFVTISSENSRYKPFDLPCEEINGVALVIGLIRVE